MLRSITIIALVIASCVPVVAQNLVVNGDFELPYFGEPYRGIPPGPYIYAWYVEPSSVDVVGSYWQAASGLQSVDLSGTHPGAIRQQLSTSAGQRYTLSFACAGNPEFVSIKTMEVWWGGVKLDTLQFDTTGHSFANMGWVYHSYTVTGSGSDTLRFASVSADNCFGPALDDISVTAVPEPSCLLVTLGGMGVLAPMLRRRAKSRI